KRSHFMVQRSVHADDSPVVRSRCMRLIGACLVLTWSSLWRLFLAFLMISLYVLGMWAGITSEAVTAYAASHQQVQPLQKSPPPRRGNPNYASNISPCPSLTGTPK